VKQASPSVSHLRKRAQLVCPIS